MLRSNVFVLLVCYASAVADVDCSNHQDGGVGECTESSSDSSSMLMNRDISIGSIAHDKEGTVLDAKADAQEQLMQRHKEIKEAVLGKEDKDSSNPGCSCDPGICYAFGDPHVYTFDGAGVAYNGEPKNIWLVHSPQVQIQAISASAGRVQGVAVGGKWMKDHKVILSNKGLTFDGKPILPKNGDVHIVEGLLELHRHHHMKPDAEEIQKLDGKDNWWSTMSGMYKKWSKMGWAFYHFKLPLNVELWISGRSDRLQVLIKMRPYHHQGGYCGNFNGDPLDDWVPGTNTRWLGHATPAGTMLDAIEEGEDLFKQAQISASSSMLQSVTHKKAECSEELMNKATEACKHVPERLLHDSCVQDICLTNDLTLAEGAMEMEVMNVVFAKGGVEFQGSGRCLDQVGAKYSTVEALSISDKKECSKLLHKVSHIPALPGKGIRGAQFNDKDNACQIIVGPSENSITSLLEQLPGLWKVQETNSGSGIVSDSDNVEGWYCWKLI